MWRRADTFCIWHISYLTGKEFHYEELGEIRDPSWRMCVPLVLFAAGGAGIMIFGIRQLILLAKNGASEFDKQPGPSEPDLSENVSSENENNSEK